MKKMQIRELSVLIFSILLVGLIVCPARSTELDESFINPPESTKPWCYWYWLNGEITADGITKDLEAMANVGIKAAMIGNIKGGGPVKMLSDEWTELTRHALKEAARVGVDIFMFNGPGWSQSGGPWIKPEQSMRRVIWNEVTAESGDFSMDIRPTGKPVERGVQNIAVLAIPAVEEVSIANTEKTMLSGGIPMKKASWIWDRSEDAADGAQIGTCYFRRVLQVEPAELSSARIILTADDKYTLWVNGKKVQSDGIWQTLETTSIIQYLKSGSNVIAIEVRNAVAGPAGMIAVIEMLSDKGEKQMISTDKSWLASLNEAPGWKDETTDPEGWKAAGVLGPFPIAPWGLEDNQNTSSSIMCYHWQSAEPFTARSMVFTPKTPLYSLSGRLFAVKPNGEREVVADIKTDRANPQTDFLPLGPEAFSFRSVKAKNFEMVVAAVSGVDEIYLNAQPMVAQYIEKQMGKLHPTPSPTWDSYIYPDSVEPDDPSVVIKQKDIINLTDKLSPEGVLTCTLPEGNWTILYFGMVTTGKENGPAPKEATGLECDKMSKPIIRYHFNSMFGRLLKDMTPEEKSAFKGITIDSYEVGSQNWTDGFAELFEERAGYNPINFLPVMTGRVVDSAKNSDGFLWDLRRIVSDMIATEYVGGLMEIAKENELSLWLENYGHWGFPGEFLVYGGQAEMIGGEFWVGQALGNIECRAASSAAHIYGKKRVYAEAFTSALDLNFHPYTFKARGEELFCEGINHFVLHVYAHQPEDGSPGKNPWFGTAFHRNTPWFNHSQDWVKYLQRVHLMLQQGEPVADVAVYIGDFAPQMTGPANPVPAGYDYDYMGSDAILKTLHVVNGEWVVYDENNPNRIAARYKCLAMPELKHIRNHVKKKLEEHKKAGGKFVDSVPVTVKDLQNAGITPIVSDTTCHIFWKARRLDDGMVFFLTNFDRTGMFEASLRVTGKAPEIFDPVTGQITKIARYTEEGNRTKICLNVKDRSDSFFIVFRNTAAQPAVTKVRAAGKDVPPADLKLYYDMDNKLTAESSKPGTYTLVMNDGSERTLVIEQKPQSHRIKGSWKKTKKDKKGYVAQFNKTFSIPEAFGRGQRISLDLGNVEIMAKVTLNGKTFNTLWMPPFELDITDALKPGDNELQILVASTSNGKAKLGKDIQLKSISRKSISQ